MVIKPRTRRSVCQLLATRASVTDESDGTMLTVLAVGSDGMLLSVLADESDCMILPVLADEK